MGLFRVDARRIDDRPRPGGWMSSGIELPTFWIEAVRPEEACAIAHDVAGTGTNATRTTVTVVLDDDGDRDAHTSTRYAKGWDEKRVADCAARVNFRYYRGDRDVTGEMYAEQDATTVTLWFSDGTHLVSMVKTPRGRWRVDSTNYVHLRLSHYDKRFRTPDECAEFVANRMGVDLVKVDEWD